MVVKKQKTKRAFLSLFLFFKYWNKSKEKKVPYFPSWSFSQVSRKVSSSLTIRVNACSSVAQYVKDEKGDKWVDGLIYDFCHINLKQICQIWYCEQNWWFVQVWFATFLKHHFFKNHNGVLLLQSPMHPENSEITILWGPLSISLQTTSQLRFTGSRGDSGFFLSC